MVVRPTLKWGEGPNLSNIILVVVVYYLKLVAFAEEKSE
jgi:hypothetical protein